MHPVDHKAIPQGFVAEYAVLMELDKCFKDHSGNGNYKPLCPECLRELQTLEW
jgi:hypothetical protein